MNTKRTTLVPALMLCHVTLLAASFAPRSVQAQVLLVGNFNNNTVGQYNATTGATIQTPFITTTSGGAANFMALDRNNHLFVSSNSGKNIVGEYDAITGAAISSAFINGQGLNSPGPVAVDGSNHLFVASGGSPGGTVGEYDATTGATIKSDFININQGLNTAEAMAIDRANNHLFVVDFNDIREFDATTGATIKYSFIHAGSPPALAVDDLNHLFVVTGNEVQEYDASTGALIKNFITGLNYPFGLVLDGNNHLFVSDVQGTVGEYNAATGATINAILVNGQGLNWPGDMVFVSSVPEPSTFVLAGIGFLILLTCIRQRRRRSLSGLKGQKGSVG